MVFLRSSFISAKLKLLLVLTTLPIAVAFVSPSKENSSTRWRRKFYVTLDNIRSRREKYLCLIPPNLSFTSPLLEDGYPPSICEAKDGRLQKKPLLLYLGGFDGTIVAPFLHFPELGTEFDVRGMTVEMGDRSTVEELRDSVLAYIKSSVINGDLTNLDPSTDKVHENKVHRPVYLIGESFGGILALEVALFIKDENSKFTNSFINLQGLVLINPATCYNRSNLARQGPPLTKVPTLLYPFALLSIIPLFIDSYAFPQLLLMLRSKALPSIIDTQQREAYMGRMAFSLPSKLKFMPRDTLKWRLNEWLAKGCKSIDHQEEKIKEVFQDIPVLVVVGEADKTLPSMSEAERLSGIFPDVSVHIVQGSGHANTSGSRVDLTALMRKRFPRLLSSEPVLVNKNRRTEMKEVASKGEGAYFGMERRYDGLDIGLSPLVYWAEGNYQKLSGKLLV